MTTSAGGAVGGRIEVGLMAVERATRGAVRISGGGGARAEEDGIEMDVGVEMGVDIRVGAVGGRMDFGAV